MLLEHNALLDTRDSLGNTPLHLACSNGHMETATLLLMVCANVLCCHHVLSYVNTVFP